MSESLLGEMGEMAGLLVETMENMGKRLIDLELSYLPLDRSSSTLSAGERQRAQLARSVRNRTTGVLYVLHEPSIGMYPAKIEGLLGVMRALLEDGNSVVFVDHDVQALRQADWLIEIGPGSGTGGGETSPKHNPPSSDGPPARNWPASSRVMMRFTCVPRSNPRRCSRRVSFA